jgi:hypothetical protein
MVRYTVVGSLQMLLVESGEWEAMAPPSGVADVVENRLCCRCSCYLGCRFEFDLVSALQPECRCKISAVSLSHSRREWL